VNSIRNAAVSLDTNVFVFALRKDTTYPACEILLFDKLSELQIYILLQIFVELQRNLTSDEMRGVLRALLRAKAVMWDYAPAPMELIARWEQQGAKKGEPSLLPTLRLRISALSFPRTATSSFVIGATASHVRQTSVMLSTYYDWRRLG
jgi:hypothetical protein